MNEHKDLSQKTSWTSGVENTIDFLAWRTKQLFGISKTELIKKTIRTVCDKQDVKDEYKKVEELLKQERRQARANTKYEDPKNGLYIDPDEALRRLKYFSEDYLNKEFDIFLSLVSDTYLNEFYSKITPIKNGEWSTHGNGKSFRDFTQSIDRKLANTLQMDNLAYSKKAQVLVANELKLGAKSGNEQILKYAYLFSVLRESNLIQDSDKLILLFIGTGDEIVTADKIKTEVEFLKKENKTSKQKFLTKKVTALASSMTIKNITWSEVIDFNEKFLLKLDAEKQQTEHKLIEGFNNSLKEKYLIYKLNNS